MPEYIINCESCGQECTVKNRGSRLCWDCYKNKNPRPASSGGGFRKKPFGKSPQEQHQICVMNALNNATVIVSAAIAVANRELSDSEIKKCGQLARSLADDNIVWIDSKREG